MALGQLELSNSPKHGRSRNPSDCGGDARVGAVSLFCPPSPEPTAPPHAQMSLGALARSDAIPFMFNLPQRKHRVSRGNGFTPVLSGLSAPSSQGSGNREALAEAVSPCSAFLANSRHPNAVAGPLFLACSSPTRAGWCPLPHFCHLRLRML